MGRGMDDPRWPRGARTYGVRGAGRAGGQSARTGSPGAVDPGGDYSLKVQTNPRSRPGQGPTRPPSPTAGSQSSWGGILSASSRKDLLNRGEEGHQVPESWTTRRALQPPQAGRFIQTSELRV